MSARRRGTARFRRVLAGALCASTALLAGCGDDAESTSTHDAGAADTQTDAGATDTQPDGAPADALSDALTAESVRGFGGPVGTRTLALRSERGELTVELWYPAASEGTAGDVFGFMALQEQRERYAEGLSRAESCGTEDTRATRDAAPALADARPLVVMSHCHHCTRFSMYTIAEQLASRGFVVAAPDHAGNTLFDRWAGIEAPLTTDTLALRTADLRAVIDALTDGSLDDTVTPLVDTENIALVGHSFGSVTVGTIAQSEPRVRAVAALATPMENPLLAGVEIDDIAAPMFFVIADEDGSITTFGNTFIEQNHEDAAERAWLLRLPDAGHWSFTNIAGVDESVQPGCGADERMTNGAAFTYPPVAEVTETVADAVSLFLLDAVSDVDAAGEALSAWAASEDTLTPPSSESQ